MIIILVFPIISINCERVQTLTIGNRMKFIVLAFGIVPLIIVFWVGAQNGLLANTSFHTAMAMALMGTLLAGLLAPGTVMHFFFTRYLNKMKEFCLEVKKGRYDVHLDVPNSSNDDGDENELVGLMRDMNWMVHCIKINDSSLRQALGDLEKSRAEIEQQKLELTEAVGKLRNLLDNVGQGFLSFGPDLQVAGEYSAECVMIFNQEIGNQAIPALLYPDDEQQQNFVKALFDKIFQEADEFLRENYFSLLPEELMFDQNTIKIDYKLIEPTSEQQHQEIMLILTDITERIVMEQRIQEEKNILSMVVQTVTHYQEFIKAVREYQLFIQEEIPNILKSDRIAAEKISVIFRSVHTWKGIFSQLGLEHLGGHLHNLENELTKLRNIGSQTSQEAALYDLFAVYPTAALNLWLEEELKLLSNILGENFFFQEETVIVESNKLRQLEEKIQKLLAPCQAKQLIADLRRLRYKPFRELLSMYPDYVVNMAANQEKEIYPFTIGGTECLVDPTQYHEFAKTLIHVFRNAVAHGLETAEERMLAAKDLKGRIHCTVEETDENIVISISDDGRGIEGQYIRELAVAKGICSTNEALTDKEAMQLIFADGFSTAACTTELAGRGVGLYAVQSEVGKLRGHIDINSEPGRGTTFRFVLPLVREAKRADMKSFGEQVLNQASSYLQQDFGIGQKHVAVVDSSANVIPMRNISTFIDVVGNLNGRLMISADENLVTRLADQYLGHDGAASYEQNLLESAFAEFFNTIVGNALQQLPEWEEDVNIGTPVTIWAKGASAKYAAAETHTWNIDIELGQLYFSVISFEKEREDLDGAGINC